MVDVIVPTYQRAALLRDALGSLLSLDGARERGLRIVVVDNGSTDGTRAVVEELRVPPGVRLDYVVEPAQGVAHARNRGVREARAEWIAFLDDDELADPRWLGELVSVAGATGARCVSGRVVLALEDGSPAPLTPFCRGLLGESVPAKCPRPLAGKVLPGTTGVLLHRSVIDAVGAFDPCLDTGCEDTDFFRRARRAGVELWYAPDARVVHRVPRYRARPEYLLWAASRHGAGYALIDRKEGGLARVLRDALLRAGQAALLTLPRYLRARASRDEGERLEQRCRLARALGYERQALRLVAPRAFAQARFFERLEFRGERARFAHAGAVRP